MKKIIALVLALAMVSLCVSALAADPVNNVTKDTNVSVSGLEDGDKVNFIQVIKWVDNTGWAWVDGMETAAGAANVSLPVLKIITGYAETDTDKPAAVAADSGSISAEHAAIIAKAAAKLSGTPHQETAVNGTATYTDAPAGLYYAQVIPATSEYLYNTIFVGADFKSENTTNTIAANTATLAATSTTNAVAKKERITMTKDSFPEETDESIKYDHDLGDEIPFKITSKVPAYAAGYINPHYVITDTMEDGLTLQNGTSGITVKIEDITVEAGVDYNIALTQNNGFTVTMTAAGLDKVAATGVAKTITVEYVAKITSLEDATVTEKTNEATVDFSNKPTDEASYALLEDRTRHYSFSLDTNLLGRSGDNYVTDELIKTGRLADGSLLETKKEYRSDTTWTQLSPLEGAKFVLFTSEPTAEEIATLAAAEASTKHFGTYTSDATGRLAISGLDADTNYYLKEIEAPAGFIVDMRLFTIRIDAEYVEYQGGSTTITDINNLTVPVMWDAYKVLSGYTVYVNDGKTTTDSVYTIEHTDDNVRTHKVDQATYKNVTGQDKFAGDDVTEIINTKGTQLPSTGGIGTTIFYIVGGLLLVGAAVILVARKKSND